MLLENHQPFNHTISEFYTYLGNILLEYKEYKETTMPHIS